MALRTSILAVGLLVALPVAAQQDPDAGNSELRLSDVISELESDFEGISIEEIKRKGKRWEIEYRGADSSNTIRVHVVSGERTGNRPENAMALSGIVAALEARDDYDRLRKLEWDHDGVWEVEYHPNDGGKIEVEIDPVSGNVVREKD